MKHLLTLSLLVAALFFSCNSKPGARAKVVNSNGDTVVMIPTQKITVSTPAPPEGEPLPGEELYGQAMDAYEAGRIKESYELCLKAANLDYPPAQFNMAIFYYNGEGVAKDHTKTFEWLLKAAPNGFAPAQKQLATCYAQGIGTKKDPKKAAEWYEKAATKGDADAQYKLGTAYYQGNGVLPDYEKAVQWYEKAAAQGHPEALNDLGLCYENGLGVPRLNPQKALRLYQASASKGNKTAKANYDRLKKQLAESKVIYEM